MEGNDRLWQEYTSYGGAVMRKRTIFVFAVLIVVILGIFTGAGVYLDWLWFRQLGYARVFETILASSWAVRFGTWFLFALFLFLNLLYTQKAVLEMPNLVLRQSLMNTQYGNLLSKKRLRTFSLFASVVISWLATAAFGGDWLTIRLFGAGADTGLSDPIFAKDIAFYLFNLPFFELLYQYLLVICITTFIICGAVYLLVHPPQQLGLRTIFVRRGAVHLSFLLAVTSLTGLATAP